jgi:hypothetical protein
MLRDIRDARFRSQQEHDDFLNFRTQTAEQLPGLFDSTLWNRLMLQASHEEEFVKDAMIAIGALHSCGRMLIEDTNKKVSSGIEPTPHYRFALQQWGRALRKMRNRITDGEKDLRVALIGCLLVFCFEGLQSNYFQSLTHAVSGHALLHSWRIKQQRLIGKDDTTSPAPHIVEDELIEAFARLDLQIMIYIDPREASIHRTLKNEGTYSVRHMPDLFTTVDEARKYWELIQRRTSHFIAAVAAVAQGEGTGQDMVEVDMGCGTGSMTFYPESEVRLALTESQSQSLRGEYFQYSGEITRWFSAFTPFYEALEEKTRSWTAASILHIQAKTAEVMLLASLFGDEFSLDNFAPTFRSLVILGNTIAADPFFATPHLFTFDTGIVNPIRLIAKWCREPVIRRASLALLRKVAVREGIYDALIMASVSEYVMRMEEEFLDEGGHIERAMRVKITGVAIDALKRAATVTCRRLGTMPDGTADERVTVITW